MRRRRSSDAADCRQLRGKKTERARTAWLHSHSHSRAHLHSADNGTIVGDLATASAEVYEERLYVFRRKSDTCGGERSTEALLGERCPRRGARCGVGEVAAQRGECAHAVSPDAASNTVDEGHCVTRIPRRGSDEWGFACG